MKIRLTILLLIATSAACSRVEEQVVSALFRNYLSAQTALAEDNYPAAQQALRALAQEPDVEIQALAQEAADCEDIETTRQKFQKLSEVVLALPMPEGHVEAYCPMVNDGQGASWVQSAGEIRNPYYGSKMLTCGEIKEGN